MEMLISHFILYARGQVQLKIQKSINVVKTVYWACKFCFKLIDAWIINKSAVGEKQNVIDVIISANKLKGVMFKMDFIELPDRHDLFLKEFWRKV